MTEPSVLALRKAYEIRVKVGWIPDVEDLEGAITQCEFFDHSVAQILDAAIVDAVSAERERCAHICEEIAERGKPAVGINKQSEKERAIRHFSAAGSDIAAEEVRYILHLLDEARNKQRCSAEQRRTRKTLGE